MKCKLFLLLCAVLTVYTVCVHAEDVQHIESSAIDYVKMADGYFYGFDVDRNLTEAFNCYKKAADLGNNYAKGQYAMCLLNGIGCTQNEEEAIAILSELARTGTYSYFPDMESTEYFGGDLMKDITKYDSIYHLALTGNAEAEYDMGCLHTRGGFERESLGLVDLVYPVDSLSFKKGLEWLEKATVHGHASAPLALGDIYIFGNKEYNISPDYNKVTEYFELAAKRGHFAAQFLLGWYYYNGIGLQKNAKKAVYWWKKSSKQGFMLSTEFLSICYYYGDGIKKSNDKAIKYFLESCYHDESPKKDNVGYGWQNHFMEYYADWYDNRDINFIKGDIGLVRVIKRDSMNQVIETIYPDLYEESVEYFKKSVRQGFFPYPPINEFRSRHLMIPWDKQVSAEYIYNAAQQGHFLAQYLMDGVGYYDVYGMDSLKKEIKTTRLEWLLKSAEQGYPNAIKEVWTVYNFDCDVNDNRLSESLKWEQRAVELGNIYAMYYLAERYLKGCGVEKNEVKAFQLFNESYNKGNIRSICYMAKCYEEGLGVERNIPKAIECYKICLDRSKSETFFMDKERLTTDWFIDKIAELE